MRRVIRNVFLLMVSMGVTMMIAITINEVFK